MFTEQHCGDAAEERYNTWSHGLGFLASLVVAGWMVWVAWGRPDNWGLAAAAAHGGTLVLLFATSTVYHGLREGRWKDRFQMADHIAIYAFIAGCHAPLAFVVLEGVLGGLLMVFQAAVAAVGIAIKLWFGPHRWPVLGVSLYTAAGASSLAVAEPLLAGMPVEALVWAVVGGAFYLFGVIFFLWEALRFNHFIWHLFVLAGAACHAWMTVAYVLPLQG